MLIAVEDGGQLSTGKWFGRGEIARCYSTNNALIGCPGDSIPGPGMFRQVHKSVSSRVAILQCRNRETGSERREDHNQRKKSRSGPEFHYLYLTVWGLLGVTAIWSEKSSSESLLLWALP